MATNDNVINTQTEIIEENDNDSLCSVSTADTLEQNMLDKRIRMREYMREYRRKYYNEKMGVPMQCPICDKQTSKSKLRRHQQTPFCKRVQEIKGLI